MDHYKSTSENTLPDMINTSTYRHFEDIDTSQIVLALQTMLSQVTPVSTLIKALIYVPSEKVSVNYLCSETQTSSITDLTIKLALLSESLCEALNIDPVAKTSERNPYLQLILASGPDIQEEKAGHHKKEGDVQQEGITLTINSFLFNAIQELRTKTTDGY